MRNGRRLAAVNIKNDVAILQLVTVILRRPDNQQTLIGAKVATEALRDFHHFHIAETVTIGPEREAD